MKIFAVIALFACSGSAIAQVADKSTQNQIDTLGLTFLHKVKPGETMYKIAKMYKMTVPQISALNPEVKVLSPGMNIHVVRKSTKPASSPNAITVPTQNLDLHVVEKGETLYSIAKKYNTSVDILRKINNFGDANLSLGQSIQVPVVNPLKGVKSPAPTKPKVETPTEKEIWDTLPNHYWGCDCPRNCDDPVRLIGQRCGMIKKSMAEKIYNLIYGGGK